MDGFQFGSAPDEERAALRGDRARCIAYLAACQGLATRMAADGFGIFSPLTPGDEALLQGFQRVRDAHARAQRIRWGV